MTDFFLLGFQKCGTTWLYKCLKDHPEICISDEDEIHYFDIHFNKPTNHYDAFFKAKPKAIIRGDTTSSYARSLLAAENIYKYNPEAKLIFTMRNPVERAFSHYWHEKRKNKINFVFNEATHYKNIGNYDLFQDWIENGFYIEHIKKYLNFFDLGNMLFLFDFELREDPNNSFKKIYSFLGVDSTFVSENLMRNINQSPNKYIKKIFSDSEVEIHKKWGDYPYGSLYPEIEFEETIELWGSDFIKYLYSRFFTFNEQLSKLIDIDLNEKWSYDE